MYTVVVFYEAGTDPEIVKHFLRSFRVL
jgi:hypothetical protein